MGSKGGIGASYSGSFSPHERVEISGKMEASLDFALGIGIVGAAVKFDPNTYDITVSASGFGGIANFKAGFWSGTLGGNYGFGAILGAKAGQIGAYGKAEIVGGREITGINFSDPLNTNSWTVRDSIDAKLKLGLLYGSAEAKISVDTENRCFLAGTPIDMWDGTQKPIEEIAAGDVVVSYDASGTLKPGRVKRTFENRVAHILDVHGLMVTPGHATYCADGKFAGRHVPMIDILRSDGALVTRDGKKVRAATNCPVGSLEDRFVKAVTFEDVPGTDSVRILDSGEIRLGTRYMRADGATMSVLETIRKMGASLSDDGHVILPGPGEKTPFFWTFGKHLPRPEDYVLQRSQLTLNDIYEADEWEAVGPQMPSPFAGEAGPGFSPSRGGVRAPGRSEPTPNIPLAMRGHPNQPTMSRRQRRAMDARQRKQQKARMAH